MAEGPVDEGWSLHGADDAVQQRWVEAGDEALDAEHPGVLPLVGGVEGEVGAERLLAGLGADEDGAQLAAAVDAEVEGIRTALYFGVACGRELRSVLEGDKTREQALGSYFAFSASHEWKYKWLLRGQKILPRIHPPLAQRIIEAGNRPSFLNWSFNHYWNIATPDIVTATPSPARRTVVPASAAA